MVVGMGRVDVNREDVGVAVVVDLPPHPASTRASAAPIATVARMPDFTGRSVQMEGSRPAVTARSGVTDMSEAVRLTRPRHGVRHHR